LTIISIWRFGLCSQLFPVGERHSFVYDFLQSLKPAFVISGCARYLLFPTMQVQAVRLADLRYFLSQFHDAFLDRILHDDRLAELVELGSADLPYGIGDSGRNDF
jgi:hypothetical protein